MRAVINLPRPFVLVLVLLTMFVTGQSQSPDDPIKLQQQGIQRLDRVLEQRRKTGDMAGTVPELKLAAVDLITSARSFVNIGDSAAAALSLSKAAYIERLLNMTPQAQASFELTYSLATTAKNTKYQLKALLGLAKLELYRSGTRDFKLVAKYLDQALLLAASSGDKESLCDAYQTRAELATELRDFTGAADEVNRSFPLAAQLSDPMYTFYAYQSRGMIYSEIAGNCDYDRGVAHCYEALDQAKSDYEQAKGVVSKLGYDFLTNVMSAGLRNLEQRRQLISLKEVDSRLSASTKIFNPQKASDVLVSQTFLPPKTSDSVKDSPEMAGLFAQLKPVLEEQIKRTSDGATGNFLRGSLKDINDEPDAALDYYLQAVKILDSDSGSLFADKSLGSFLEDKIQIYYSPMLHLLERQRYAEAFDLMENSRSRAMVELLRTQSLKFSAADQRTYADYLDITAKLSLSHQNVFRARNDPDTEENRQKIAALENKIQDLEKEYRNVLDRMRSSNSGLVGLVGPQTANLQALQQSMKQDRYETLYYLALDKQLIIWHISADETHVVSVFLPRLELIKKVKSLRDSLKRAATDETAKFDEQTAREMFLFLVQPVLKWIKTDQLVIVPHEDLNYIPFQVFYDGDSKKYLGEMFQLSYAPSASILGRLKKLNGAGGGSLLAVDSSSLVEGENEVNALGRLYPQHSKIVVDQGLSETDLKSWIGNYDLIHLSVHGKFENPEPLLSYLMLTKGGADDGKLTTAEMFGLPLNKAKLVVLSACETGEAKATRANEVIGMQRALLYAGANNLILSSWKVDAASTELWMTTFYREAQSKPFSEASRLASMAVKSKFNHPYHWSPFLLIGK